MRPAPVRAARDADGTADAVAVRSVLDRAAEVLASHTEREAMCGGCLDEWARLAPFPCEQARWAVAVVERYGAPDQRPATRMAAR